MDRVKNGSGNQIAPIASANVHTRSRQAQQDDAFSMKTAEAVGFSPRQPGPVR
jgi:hypothetical protein